MRLHGEPTSRTAGFTLVEGLIVLAIIVVVGGVGFFAYHKHNQAHAAGWTTIASSGHPNNNLFTSVKGCKVVLDPVRGFPRDQVYFQATRKPIPASGYPYIHTLYVGSTTGGTPTKDSTWGSNNVNEVSFTVNPDVTEVALDYDVASSATKSITGLAYNAYLWPSSLATCNFN